MSLLTQRQVMLWFNDTSVVSDDCVPSSSLDKTHMGDSDTPPRKSHLG